MDTSKNKQTTHTYTKPVKLSEDDYKYVKKLYERGSFPGVRSLAGALSTIIRAHKEQKLL